MLEDLRALAVGLGPTGYLGSFTAHFDHGLLLIEDLNSRAVHDEWCDPESLVNLRPDSLCVRTQAYVDGPVSVFIFRDGPSKSSGHVVFDGDIESPSGAIKVEDSDSTARIMVTAVREVSRITIMVDDLGFVTCVAIIVRG